MARGQGLRARADPRRSGHGPGSSGRAPPGDVPGRRAEGVRRVSADLLCRLPSSAFIGRAEALARTHVVVTRRLLRAPRVELLPVVPTDELTRDQYTAEGHLASAALDVVSRVPIHRWRSLIGLSATELLEADVRYEGRPADLSEALTRAALRWEDGSSLALWWTGRRHRARCGSSACSTPRTWTHTSTGW